MAQTQLFDGRVALVTGAGRGIGRAHALLLARLGAKVVVNDLGGGVMPGSAPSSAPSMAVAAEILSAGGVAIADHSDISTPDGAATAVDRAIRSFGRIDCVINNAGTSLHKEFVSVTSTELEAMLRVHVGGHFYVTQMAWPHMAAQGYGRVVMTTSGSGLFGSSHNHHYAAAKGAIVGLTRSLAIDAAPLGIRVNAIAPLAATRLADNIGEPRIRTAFQAKMRTDQVAPLAAWLSHEHCSVNGEVFEVGGGFIAKIFTAEGAGFFDPDHEISDISGHLEQILSEVGYALPKSGEETAFNLLKKIGVAL